MIRPVLAICLLPFVAAGARGGGDAIEALGKAASRLEMKSKAARGIWGEKDRAALTELCDRALDVAIDLRHDKRGFDAYMFVLDWVAHVDPPAAERLFVEAMDGMIESYLDDDRLASIVLTVLSYPPKELADEAQGYVEWIGRDSKSKGVHCAFTFKKIATEAAATVDVARCRELVAALKELDREFGERPGRYAWETWSQILREEIEGLALVGEPVPEMRGVDVDGVEMALADYHGKAVLLDFWGFWCPPCRSMFPLERALVERRKDQPFVLLGVNSDANYPKARKDYAAEAIPWRSFADARVDPATKKTVKFSELWKVAGWPTLFLIDGSGIVRHRWIGPPPEGVLDLAIDRLLAESGAAAPPR